MTVELPAGIEHGTPEGYAAGCRRERDCPALHTHGMACLFAHVRSQTDPRYYKAKVRDPRPAAIAARLGIRPPARRITVVEDELDEEAEVLAETHVFQPGRGWHKKPGADQPPVNNPEPSESAAPKPTEALAAADASTTEPAQPLAEQSQDTEPQEDAVVPAIEEETPAFEPPTVEVEDMGHPTSTSEETTVTTTAPEYSTDFDLQCAAAIATPAGRKKVRDWARAKGFDVPDRGRIPSLFVRSYVKARGEHPAPADDGSADDVAAVAAEIVDRVTEPDDLDTIVATTTADPYATTVDDTVLADILRQANGQVPIEGTIVIEGNLSVSDALAAEFRPDWAGVTIPEAIRAARAIAARLEEDNARLTANQARLIEQLARADAALDGLQAAFTELEEASREKNREYSELESDYQALLARHDILKREARTLADTVAPRVEQIETAMREAATAPAAAVDVTDAVVTAYQRQIELTERSLEFALRKYDQAKREHQADNDLHHALIDRLQEKLRIETVRREWLDDLLMSSLERESDHVRTIRQLRETAALPFWRRRR